jgi:deoxyribodipyrimidine photo-lyase
MVESLEALDNHLCDYDSRLYYFEGTPNRVVDDIIKQHKIDAVFVNMDYTPYSKIRDDKISETCKRNNVAFVSVEDYLLYPIKSILTGDNTVYHKFTPFYDNAIKKLPPKPVKLAGKNFIKNLNKLSGESNINIHTLYEFNKNIFSRGGRGNAQKLLSKVSKLKKYEEIHNELSNSGTTKLSAAIKFGNISIREVYWKIRTTLGGKSKLIEQLLWREFYYNIAYDDPRLLGSSDKIRSFLPKYAKIKWSNNKKHFDAWARGTTGFPIIDAGMRQLNATGHIHNRIRLLVADFLVKLLHIDWQIGEQYFAQKLVDYDPAVNNGNWQWVASTNGMNPYFRIMNPWIQTRVYDNDCIYIKKWIPELADVPCNIIHTIYDETVRNYPKPIVDYKTEKELSIKLYSSI